MNNYTKKVLHYNILSDDKVKLHLQNLLLSIVDLDKLFYKIIFKYIDPKYINRYYKDLIYICSEEEVDRVILARIICNITKDQLSNNFRYVNKIYKHIKPDTKKYKENVKTCICMKYYDPDVILTEAQSKEGDIYTILVWLYEKYRDPLIIRYICYVNVKKSNKLFTNLPDNLEEYNTEYLKNDIDPTKIEDKDIHTNKDSPLYKKYKSK